MIGSLTYVVGSAQNARDRATYESLVFGERLLISERVMSEIFGEQEMLLLHRVALEMSYADRVMGRPRVTDVPQGFEIIQLDDDDDILEASEIGSTVNGTPAATGGRGFGLTG
ncbi:uncharacterized protein LOC130495646 [Raphanus sativus]|uniref:Uncharacterized protein LOC130495646 n=1 Tax=Raphanus sativus TaxID=3726 RepID=A0A9W3BUU1_RAPSA|nr:uncharacterized protein LOC130495646 [Raphanus sativus]